MVIKMKNKLFSKIAVLLALIISIITPLEALAETPYKTYTKGPESMIVETQTAYEPLDILKLPTNAAEDMCLDKDNTLYIADTGNSRILILKNKDITVLGEGILNKPTGVFVTDDKVYVADSENRKVFIFDKEGKVIQEIGRPTEPLYGKNTQFIPKKLTVDNRGNIYVISEGSTNGVVQLNNQGQFTSYFASNRTETTFKMILQRLMFTENQKGQLFKNTPPSPTNVTIDERGLVYTATYGLKANTIKKFNVSGNNILDGKIENLSNVIIDIEIDKNGNIFAVDENGSVFEFDSYGNLLFAFGGISKNGEINGLVKNPSAISISNDGMILVLDKEKNIIQTYSETNFAKEVHEGVSLYKEGLYLQSEENWQNILKMNSSFILSYQALAKSYFKQGLNDEALENFKLGEDKVGYSDAYWEIRNDWLQANLGKVIIALILIIVIWSIVKRIDKKKGIFNRFRALSHKIKENKLISQILYAKRFIRKPLDSYYELKRMNKVSVFSSTVLYIWLIVIQITGIYFKGYLFQNINPLKANIFKEVLIIIIPIVLFIIANYMIATINDGEGKIKDVYNGTIYALTPYLIGMLPLQLITNILTLNESFIYDFGTLIIYGWCAILLFLMIKEVHNYSTKETIKNILLTVFGMMIIVLLVAIIFILVDHELDFINSIIQELKIRG